MTNSANHSPQDQVVQIPQPIPAAHSLNIPPIPLELWEQIFLVLLHGAVEDYVTLRDPGIFRQPWYGCAFKSLRLTCRALYMVGEQVRRRLHIISRRRPPKGSVDLTRFSEFRGGEPRTELLFMGEAATALIPWLIGDGGWLEERLELVDISLDFNILETIIRINIRRLKIRSCRSSKGLGPLPSHLRDKDVCDVIQVLPIKAVQLELNYAFRIRRELPREVTFLAFLPSLETLALCGKSFGAITQLPKTLPLPPLQHLTITDHQPYSFDKENVISYFTRCSKLKTLSVDETIQTWAPAQGDTPVNLPDLMEYKGPVELLTLLHAPNLRFALATGLEWDGGALIQSLTTGSSTLQSLVIELTARAEDPVCKDIQASDDFFLSLFISSTLTLVA
ncbi:hypothetical protein FRC04_002792 [Tulasnella sp. 424]|nr:hypothetical protein FRC04_002792 [Tulasnella sp. 424]KAG8966605.1 hypothetical protein FRC05_002481 [Tulasnella sp. 425]